MEEKIGGKKLYKDTNQSPAIKPMNALLYDVPEARTVIHKQVITLEGKASFEIELSWQKIHFYIVGRRTLLRSLPAQYSPLNFRDQSLLDVK